MIITATVASMILMGQTPPQPKVYQNERFMLQFQYPQNWTLRKERLYDVMEFPLESGGTAEVQIFPTYYRQTPDQWQAVQADVAETLGRTIDRQWQEVILGVPLLLTRMYFVRGGDKMSTLVGLLYTDTPEKLNYRLTANAEKAEEAEAAWRQTLSSLRTLDGQTPGVENPANVPPDEVDPPRPNVLTDKTPKFPVIKNRRDEKRVNVSVQGSEVPLKLPREWSVVTDGEVNRVVREDGLKGTATIRFNLGSTEDAKGAVIEGANTTLSEFTTVNVRDDWTTKFTDGGAILNGVMRKGLKGENEEHVVLFASGARGLYYWVVEYRAASHKDAEDDMKHLKRLFDYLLVDAPQ